MLCLRLPARLVGVVGFSDGEDTDATTGGDGALVELNDALFVVEDVRDDDLPAPAPATAEPADDVEALLVAASSSLSLSLSFPPFEVSASDNSSTKLN